jgi:molybdopterin-binding protein
LSSTDGGGGVYQKGLFVQSRAGLSAHPILTSAVRCEIVVFEEKNSMALSARNHLKGEITEVILGTVTALITLKVGDNVVESVITKRSAEEMGLKKGDKVTAVIKATEVMIQKG